LLIGIYLEFVVWVPPLACGWQACGRISQIFRLQSLHILPYLLLASGDKLSTTMPDLSAKVWQLILIKLCQKPIERF
jgi:hypothetical protein